MPLRCDAEVASGVPEPGGQPLPMGVPYLGGVGLPGGRLPFFSVVSFLVCRVVAVLLCSFSEIHVYSLIVLRRVFLLYRMQREPKMK